MLGVNQTIMMALSMLVITALVGTRELGQEVYIALTKADTGRGIVAGVCVAFIAIIAELKKRMGEKVFFKIEYVDIIPRMSNGKFRSVINKVSLK